MKYMISYDISVSRKRYEVVKILEEFGCNRVQKSIYFGDLTKENYLFWEKILRNFLEKKVYL